MAQRRSDFPLIGAGAHSLLLSNVPEFLSHQVLLKRALVHGPGFVDDVHIPRTLTGETLGLALVVYKHCDCSERAYNYWNEKKPEELGGRSLVVSRDPYGRNLRSRLKHILRMDTDPDKAKMEFDAYRHRDEPRIDCMSRNASLGRKRSIAEPDLDHWARKRSCQGQLYNDLLVARGLKKQSCPKWLVERNSRASVGCLDNLISLSVTPRRHTDSSDACSFYSHETAWCYAIRITGENMAFDAIIEYFERIGPHQTRFVARDGTFWVLAFASRRERDKVFGDCASRFSSESRISREASDEYLILNATIGGYPVRISKARLGFGVEELAALKRSSDELQKSVLGSLEEGTAVWSRGQNNNNCFENANQDTSAAQSSVEPHGTKVQNDLRVLNETANDPAPSTAAFAASCLAAPCPMRFTDVTDIPTSLRCSTLRSLATPPVPTRRPHTSLPTQSRVFASSRHDMPTSQSQPSALCQESTSNIARSCEGPPISPMILNNRSQCFRMMTSSRMSEPNSKSLPCDSTSPDSKCSAAVLSPMQRQNHCSSPQTCLNTVSADACSGSTCTDKVPLWLASSSQVSPSKLREGTGMESIEPILETVEASHPTHGRQRGRVNEFDLATEDKSGHPRSHRSLECRDPATTTRKNVDDNCISNVDANALRSSKIAATLDVRSLNEERVFSRGCDDGKVDCIDQLSLTSDVKASYCSSGMTYSLKESSANDLQLINDFGDTVCTQIEAWNERLYTKAAQRQVEIAKKNHIRRSKSYELFSKPSASSHSSRPSSSSAASQLRSGLIAHPFGGIDSYLTGNLLRERDVIIRERTRDHRYDDEKYGDLDTSKKELEQPKRRKHSRQEANDDEVEQIPCAEYVCGDSAHSVSDNTCSDNDVDAVTVARQFLKSKDCRKANISQSDVIDNHVEQSKIYRNSSEQEEAGESALVHGNTSPDKSSFARSHISRNEIEVVNFESSAGVTASGSVNDSSLNIEGGLSSLDIKAISPSTTVVVEQSSSDEMSSEREIIDSNAYVPVESQAQPMMSTNVKASKLAQEHLEEFSDLSCARTCGFIKEEWHKGQAAQVPEELEERLRSSFMESTVCNAEASKSARGNRRELRQFRQELLEVSRGTDLMAMGFLTQRKKKLMFGKSRIHGMGLYACEDIPAGDFLIEYVGEVVRRAIADVREKTYERQGMGDSYLFRLTGELVVDATRKGSLARFVNHSCEPSVIAKIITVNGTEKIVFYSKRSLKKGEELTYDYKFAFEEEDAKVPCFCGAPACRRYLN